MFEFNMVASMKSLEQFHSAIGRLRILDLPSICFYAVDIGRSICHLFSVFLDSHFRFDPEIDDSIDRELPSF